MIPIYTSFILGVFALITPVFIYLFLLFLAGSVLGVVFKEKVVYPIMLGISFLTILVDVFTKYIRFRAVFPTADPIDGLIFDFGFIFPLLVITGIGYFVLKVTKKK